MVTQKMFGDKSQYVTALYLIECLKQIKWQRLILTCAPISELPSHISTVVKPPSFPKYESQIDILQIKQIQSSYSSEM